LSGSATIRREKCRTSCDATFRWAHWPFIAEVELTEAQRVAMNRLALRFSCEMVAHFERYIVDYLERHRGRLHGALSERAARVFADVERAHIGGFLRLLRALEPGDYRGERLAFFRWTAIDDAVVALAPAVTFFVADHEKLLKEVGTALERAEASGDRELTAVLEESKPTIQQHHQSAMTLGTGTQRGSLGSGADAPDQPAQAEPREQPKTEGDRQR
jgi:hypothetical protein